MHSRTSGVHAVGLDSGRRPGSRKGPGVDLCQCGCGSQLPRSKPSRKRRFVLGHQVKGRTIAQWEREYSDLLLRAPLCKCGCGERVVPVASTIERFIKWRGVSEFPDFIRGHLQRHEMWHTALTEQERRYILGTLLGDSSIGLPSAASLVPRITCNHSVVQRRWAEFKRRGLARIGATTVDGKNDGFGEAIVRLRTPCLPCLSEIDAIVKRDGRKSVTTEWLDKLGPEGLAWWIGDDGSRSLQSITLHTEGYRREESELIARWFADNFGPASVVESRGHFRVYLYAKTSRVVSKYVTGSLPSFVLYKLANR
jgi:hypothetical protein